MHVILIAALPVDASGEAVLLEDLLDLAAHGDGVGVILRIELLAGDDLSVGIDVGVGLIVDVDGGAGIVLGVAAGGPVGDDGVDGILLLALVDLLEAALDGGHQILVDVEGAGLGDLFGANAVLEVPDLD